MSNERITESIIRNHFKDNDIIIISEQTTTNDKIQKLLKNASKSGKADGRPDFIIEYKDNGNIIIVIECKADTNKHESLEGNNYADFAVDGVKLYTSFLSKEFDVIAIAVSGIELENLKVSHFLQLKGTNKFEPIFKNQLLNANEYLNGYKKDERKFHQDFMELLIYSKVLNEELHTLKIKESERSILIAGTLIALDNKNFREGYKTENNINNLIDSFLSKIKSALLNVENKNIDAIITTFNFIKTHTILSKDLKIFKDIITQIDDNIYSFVKNYKYFDTLGQFYIEFLRYANNDKGLGIVLTPPHITELFCELAQINENSVILDNCAGTGGFLISAMHEMLKDASGSLSREQQIKAKQIIGIELQHDIFTLLCCNMYIHGDGRSNLIKGSCFDEKVKEQVRKLKPNVGFLNPPYKSDKRKDIEELSFVLNNLSFLEKGCYCIAIIPSSCAISTKNKIKGLKEKLLQEHTLDAVLSMPNELFKNSEVSVNTCIMIFKAKEPHPKDYKTWFGYCKYDGFTNRKTQGRADYDKKWENEIKKYWTNTFRNRDEIVGFSVKTEVTAKDEWCVEAYMETDYSKLNKVEFENNLLKYSTYLFFNKINDLVSKQNIKNINYKLDTTTWKSFLITDLFKIEKGSIDTISKTIEGNIPLISSTETNNGVNKFITDDKKLFKGNKITVASNGSVGETFYQPQDFYATGDTNILIPLFDMNSFIAFFIVTIIKNEKYRYDYGRKWGKTRMAQDTIKLPATQDGKPDFEFMENYIKSLPYSKNLE